MKTIDEVKNEISLILLNIKDLNKEFTQAQKSKEGKKLKNAIKKHSQRIRELKQLILYLESNPSPQFLRNQKEDLNKKIKAIDQRF